MARRIARPIHLVVAWLLVAGLLVQVFLAGMGVFDSSSMFATHRDFGYTLTLLPVVLIVTSLVGGFGRWETIAAAVMFGQFILQSVLVLQRDSTPAIAALHPVNGFLILLIAVWLARDAWRRWQVPAVDEPAEARSGGIRDRLSRTRHRSGMNDEWRPMTDRFETLAVHAGAEPDPETGAVVPAIQMSVTFKQDGVGGLRGGFEYGRSGNPTRAALEAAIAALENGTHGIAFASGLAATQAVGYLFDPGDRLLMSDDVYGGTWRLADKVWRRYGIETDPIDLRDLDAVAAAFAAEKPPRMVWIETPSNPLMKIIDISAVARLAAVAGALTVVDNTFATPYLQRPLEFGADLVVHSATKYLGGHSDVVGGLIATRSGELAERLHFHQNAAGAVPSPFDCFLILRGLRTLALRMERSSANALVLALWLGDRPEVEAVHYPGQPDHPAAALVGRQMRLPGGMLSIELRDGEERARRFAAATRLFTLAESLGGVESLIELPAPMTHASVADSPLAVPPGLVRLSVGIENAEDLRADLESAFAASAP